jgi:hypothetical protein
MIILANIVFTGAGIVCMFDKTIVTARRFSPAERGRC